MHSVDCKVVFGAILVSMSEGVPEVKGQGQAGGPL